MLKRLFNLTLICFGCTLLLHTEALAQSKNVKFEQQGEQLVITYDLIAKRPNQKHNVSIAASFDQGRTFEPLLAVQGDVGKNVRPGLRKIIHWDVLHQFPNGIEGDVMFKVDAKTKGNNKILLYVMGGLAVGGGACALLCDFGPATSGEGDFSEPVLPPTEAH